ncbi:hydroxyacid dehydrogenase [Croceicoccus estronivorus]|uniref:FAD-binding oxidoreductase n=1 Tax=Croceicoccus estronivorus TaxID=1172626 RepID=UPI0008304F85|nr:FAD-binding oxidoreductase [Croceicoccus estronivorus]OCC23056.1 hydroxyacid dehydrogenase [Croceicoccus estronivorus]
MSQTVETSRDLAPFLNKAERILGPRGLTRDPDLLDPWLTDWRGVYKGEALAMASPASAEEVAALVRLCVDHDVAIVPQGGNSGMCGGATPDSSGRQLLLSLRRMDTIHTIDAESLQVTCEAGVVLQNLHEAAERESLRFPLTLGGKGSATIGGLISTNAGGTQVLRHGTMRAQVLGLQAVLADGSLFNGLTPLKKDNRGFDLKQLLIGSEGTLGIVTAATLRLLPAIGARRVLWAGLASLQRARALLLHCEATAAEAVEGFEIIPAYSLAAVLKHIPGSRAPLDTEHPWHVLIELVADPSGADQLQDLAERLLASALENGLIDNATIAANDAQAEAFWLLRESISAAERARGPAVQHDISVAVEKMPDFVDMVTARVEERFPGTRAIAYGHLGDGNVHLHVLAPPGSLWGEWQKTEGKPISAFVYDCVTEWGGSISAEHGIGQAKLSELARLGDPVRLGTMRTVKKALDPLNILNPGKLVPLAPEQSTP